MSDNPYSTAILAWYETHARDLPWRSFDACPWSILVSEIMLQQTPVARVLPVWQEWTKRWPTPADLASEPSGEAVRMWGRLGYPRRALRLHACAVAITEEHGGKVPEDHATLLSLPGVGAYTAAAVASFAFGQRHAIVDTNVRRVLARTETGIEYPPKTQTAAETALAESLLPPVPSVAARWGVAVMELGALVCTARNPSCAQCPIANQCSWKLAGKPAYDGPPRRAQTYAGTDRQVRGRLLAVLSESEHTDPQSSLDVVWDEQHRHERIPNSMVEDGLVDPLDDGRYALPA